MQSKPPAGFFVSFLVGAAAGAIAALLFTPHSGRENRRQALEVADNQRQALASLHESYKEVPNNWKIYFSSIRERFIMAFQAGMEEMQRTREEWLAKADPNG